MVRFDERDCQLRGREERGDDTGENDETRGERCGRKSA